VSHPPARQTVAPGRLPRHRHAEGYAPSSCGAYEEAGDRGRRRVVAGDVVVHQAWEAHLNRTLRARRPVLNLPRPGRPRPRSGRVTMPTPGARRERDPASRTAPARNSAGAGGARRLARILAAGLRSSRGAASLRDWAGRFGLSAEHLSRRFGRLYRRRARSGSAGKRAPARPGATCAAPPTPLAQIALAHGLRRPGAHDPLVCALTGRPARGLGAVNCVQDGRLTPGASWRHARRDLILAGLAAATPSRPRGAIRTQVEGPSSEGWTPSVSWAPRPASRSTRATTSRSWRRSGRVPGAAQAAWTRPEAGRRAGVAARAQSLCTSVLRRAGRHLDDIMASLDHAEGRLLEPYRASPYWDEDSWKALLASRPR
jgi:hypothetical protein